jgi:PAS domain-containing protein
VGDINVSGFTDPVPHWTRQILLLRSEFSQLSRRGGAGKAGDLVESALSACDSLVRDLAGAKLECEHLRAEVRTADIEWSRLFDSIPGACLLTDAAGCILNANHAAGVLLNVSAKHLKNRQLRVFTEDRDAFGTLLVRVSRETDCEVRATLTFRPRERRPTPIEVIVRALSEEREDVWIWFLASWKNSFFADATPSVRPSRRASGGDDAMNLD